MQYKNETVTFCLKEKYMKQPFYAVNKIMQVSARVLVLKLPFNN